MLKKRQILTVILTVIFVAACLLTVKRTLDDALATGSHRHGVITNEQTLHPSNSTLTAAKLVPTLKKKVNKNGDFYYKQDLQGFTCDFSGIQAAITSEITTEMIYSFSPASEEMFGSKLVDPNHEQKIYANSPAMIWDGQKFVVVMRMWLDKEHTKGKTQNIFSDNYFYMRTFDDSMKPLDVNGRVLGIVTRVHEALGDGPIEPRAFPFHDHLYLSFNCAVKVDKKLVDTTMFWSVEQDKFVMPEISDGQPQLQVKKSMPRDKHWSPYSTPDGFYMVYSLDPLRIVKCNTEAVCRFSQNAAPSDYVFKDYKDCLRGGTPTVHYKNDYYISIAHSTLFKKNDRHQRYYTVNLVVLKTGTSKHKIVYISEPIDFNPKLMSSVPIVRTDFIKDPFLFPVTLLVEDYDNIVIGGHVNDHSSFLFRLRGLENLMNKVMNASDNLNLDGPKVGFLHDLVRDMAADKTGIPFLGQK